MQICGGMTPHPPFATIKETMPRTFVTLILLSTLLPTVASAQSTVTLSGVITDEVSGDLVPGATVIVAERIPGTDSLRIITGAAANVDGFYSIPGVPAGEYQLVVRSIGYLEWRQAISVGPGKKNRNDVAVTPSPDETTVTVIADRTNEPVTRQVGAIEIPVEDLARLPQFGGESDVLRTLQLLPGVQQVSEISSGLYVRGGSADQNLVLLDDVVLYNPTHLAGFLSTFNSDAIRTIDLIKGAFPAKYGGRLSSVLDLTMREGTREKLSGAGGVSLISSRLTLEGPINDNSTFMLSGRRFYLDLIKNLAGGTDIPDYYFYDLNGKANYRLGESDRLYVGAYHGRDVVTFSGDNEEIDVNWGNTTGIVRWTHILSPSAFNSLSVSYTGYEFLADLRNTDEQLRETDLFGSSSAIRDLRIKERLQLFPSPDHIVETGLELTRHASRVRAVQITSGDSSFVIPDSLGLQNATAYEGSLYAQDEWKVNDRLAVNLGGRLTWFEKGNYFFAEPRASAVYRLQDNLSLSGSYSESNQPVHLVVRNGISLPTDTWFPATEKIAPGFSRQGSLGVMGTIDEGTWKWSVEGYYKQLDNLYEFSDTASFNPFISVEEQLVEGEGEAWGVELFVEKRIGAFTGWIGYTLSETTRFFEELNRGRPFHPRYDRRHDAKVVLMYRLGDSWDFGMTWVYGTGQAYTVPTGNYVPVEPEYPWFPQNDPGGFYWTDDRHTERNGFRLPAYHRLDVNFSHNFEWFEIPWVLSLNVYNVYNRRNVFAWYLDDEYDPETGESRPTIQQFTLFPIIPTVGLSFSF